MTRGQAGEEKRDTPFIPGCVSRNRLFVNFCEVIRNVSELAMRVPQDAGLKPFTAQTKPELQTFAAIASITKH